MTFSSLRLVSVRENSDWALVARQHREGIDRNKRCHPPQQLLVHAALHEKPRQVHRDEPHQRDREMIDPRSAAGRGGLQEVPGIGSRQSADENGDCSQLLLWHLEDLRKTKDDEEKRVHPREPGHEVGERPQSLGHDHADQKRPPHVIETSFAASWGWREAPSVTAIT